MFYRKKPGVIEAFRWTGGPDQEEDPLWAAEAIRDGRITFLHEGTPDCALQIHTLEGVMTANQGDFIILGAKGEIYPCKLDIFYATYEPVCNSMPVTLAH
jgi:hypothetical protein